MSLSGLTGAVIMCSMLVVSCGVLTSTRCGSLPATSIVDSTVSIAQTVGFIGLARAPIVCSMLIVGWSVEASTSACSSLFEFQFSGGGESNLGNLHNL